MGAGPFGSFSIVTIFGLERRGAEEETGLADLPEE